MKNMLTVLIYKKSNNMFTVEWPIHSFLTFNNLESSVYSLTEMCLPYLIVFFFHLTQLNKDRRHSQ
jgi:hypothetical protein